MAQIEHVVVSLTVSGDASPASTLAVTRFPVAYRHGRYTYVRKLHIPDDISQAIAHNLDRFHVVVHGIDTNHNAAYDFSKGRSELDASLPQEATVPAA